MGCWMSLKLQKKDWTTEEMFKLLSQKFRYKMNKDKFGYAIIYTDEDDSSWIRLDDYEGKANLNVRCSAGGDLVTILKYLLEIGEVSENDFAIISHDYGCTFMCVKCWISEVPEESRSRARASYHDDDITYIGRYRVDDISPEAFKEHGINRIATEIYEMGFCPCCLKCVDYNYQKEKIKKNCTSEEGVLDEERFNQCFKE